MYCTTKQKRTQPRTMPRTLEVTTNLKLTKVKREIITHKKGKDLALQINTQRLKNKKREGSKMFLCITG